MKVILWVKRDCWLILAEAGSTCSLFLTPNPYVCPPKQMHEGKSLPDVEAKNGKTCRKEYNE
jgi:hypothetical protein